MGGQKRLRLARFCQRQLAGRFAADARSFREWAEVVRSQSGALRGVPVRMGSAPRGTSRREGKSFPFEGHSPLPCFQLPEIA